MHALRLRLCLWSLVAALSVFGLVMVASVTGTMGAPGDGFNERFIVRQLAALLIGIFLALGLSWGVADWIGRSHVRAPLVLGLSMLLLAAVPFVGEEINGARRWFHVGPINVQPSELAKLSLILCGAWYFGLVAKERVKLHWEGIFVPVAAFAVLAALTWKTRDLGSIVVMAALVWTMLFFSGARWLYSTTVGLLLLPLAAYVAIFSEGYRRERMTAYLDPFSSDSPAAYHVKQSLIAVGSGGVSGQGLGEGLARGAWLPERHTDFIYAMICQETGFIGASLVCLTYVAFAVVGLMIANAARDRYGRILAVGATMLISLQAFWNMTVVLGLAPTKGLTLPFISYGGTSLVVCLGAVGLLDAVARTMRDPLQLSRPEPRQLGVITMRSQQRAALW